MFRPYFLEFSGLALAVALWGFGYKLSRYRHPAPAQRAIVAKLWVEPPNASILAVQKLKDQSNFTAYLQLLHSSIEQPSLDNVYVYVGPVKVGGLQAFDFPAQLRSPPQRVRKA